MSKRNLFHYPDMTDLGKMREEAIAHAADGDFVLLHKHDYEEFAPDGCSWWLHGKDPAKDEHDHEVFGAENA